MSRMTEIIQELAKYDEEIEYIRENIGGELSNLDKEVNDIYHFIEFNDLNACEGFKAYKDLQRVLRKRREVKNDIEILKNVFPHSNGLTSTIKSGNNAMKIIDNKMYSPRVREDLFETKEDVAPNMLIRAKDGTKLLGEFDTYDKALAFLKNKFGSQYEKCHTTRVINKIDNSCKTGISYNGIIWERVA